jgi:hypothetical protein
MNRTLPVVLIAALTGTSFAAATPAEKCAAAKIKAAGAGVYGAAKCHSKALSKSASVDGACLAKAAGKLGVAYAKAEAAGGCAATGEADGAEAAVDACLETFADAIAGDAKCAATKMKAVGKKAAAKAKCHYKALLTGASVDSSCLGSAETKFNAAIAKANAAGSCTDTAAALEQLVDDCLTTLLEGSDSSTPTPPVVGSPTPTKTPIPDDGDDCALNDDTSATSTVSPDGCAVLERDTSSCDAARAAAGLSGYWLKFSCRVTLSQGASGVVAQADGQPDYLSNYFQTTNPCHETYTGAIQNPNLISAQSYTVTFPANPNTTAQSMMMTAVVGLALNGVPIFGNFAAPGDDIFEEAETFDRCGAHPQMAGKYHYHSEPYAISYDDSNFIGVMRDGYPIYGRRDPSGSLPTLDAFGGHTGVTVDSPSTPVYHYHVNEQTSTNPGTMGEKQWFLTTGTFRGTPGACTGGC